jgi:hypothetical protein
MNEQTEGVLKNIFFSDVAMFMYDNSAGQQNGKKLFHSIQHLLHPPTTHYASSFAHIPSTFIKKYATIFLTLPFPAVGIISEVMKFCKLNTAASFNFLMSLIKLKLNRIRCLRLDHL